MSKKLSASFLLLAAVRVACAASDSSYGHLPMAFEHNEGQASSCGDFVARGHGYNLLLAPSAATLSLRGAGTMRMSLVGAQPQAHGAGDAALEAVSNYFVGNQPKNWRTGIPNYGKVTYANVYRGIDLVYYGNQQQLEYDFVVAPGSSPKDIELDFQGAQDVTVTPDGDLSITVGANTVIQHKPVIYQIIGGARRAVSGSYATSGTHVRINVGKYDHAHPLVIDPTLSYSTYFGGKDFDEGDSIAVDSQGNAYVTGFLYAPAGSRLCGHDQNSSTTRSQGSAFIAKLSADGSRLLYSTILGGDSQDAAHGIAVDTSGNAYVTGYTRSSDFPVTRGAIQRSLGKGATQNAFVTRLDSRGELAYSTYLGGSSSDEGRGIAVDARNRVFVVGQTSSQNFPTTSHALQQSLLGLQNVFVTSLNASTNALEYSTLLGGNNYDFGFGIAVGQDGTAYVTGATYAISSSTFPVTGGAYQTAMAGSGDAFVSHISADGSKLLYSTFLGGTDYDGARGIAVDTTGNAYVTGFTRSANFPSTAAAAQTALNGDEDAFVTKLNPTGTALVYSTFLGGSAEDASYGLAVGRDGTAYLTGFTQSADFPTTAGALQLPNGSGRLPFVAAVNPNGSQLTYSTCLGGTNGDGARAIALDSKNNAYVTGYTRSTDFPVTGRAQQTQLDSAATQDAFISKLAF